MSVSVIDTADDHYLTFLAGGEYKYDHQLAALALEVCRPKCPAYLPTALLEITIP